MDMFWHGIDFNEGSTKFSDYSTNICVQPVIDSIIYQWYPVFRAKDKMNSQKCKCTSQIKFLFLSPRWGCLLLLFLLRPGASPLAIPFLPFGHTIYTLAS